MARTPVAERVYRLLLRCYPGEFRDEYEREMLLAFRDRLDRDRGTGMRAVIRLWGQLLVDSVLRAPGEHLDVLRQDVRYGLRSLRRTPLFTATALATLALGIGANAAIFSVVHAVALRPLPYPSPDALVRIWETNESLSITGFAVSFPNFVSWTERARTLELGAWQDGSATIQSGAEPVRVRSLSVTPAVLDILGASPLLGRGFAAADAEAGAPRVVLIRDSLWRSHFGGRPDIVGSSMTVAGQPHTILGIVASGSVPFTSELFLPLRIDLARENRDNHVASVIGRVRPGHGIEQARQEMAAIARQLESEFPGSNRGWGIELSTVYEWLVPEATRLGLYVLLAAVGCVLLIACANVANLMLARASSRRREMAVRVAIGAGRRRLVRQVLTEGLLLAGAGGGAGVLLAWWTVPVLRAWLPATLARGETASVNAPVLVFALAACVVTGLAFALLPALAAARGGAGHSLNEGARGNSAAGAGSRHVLAAAQVAIATVLLVCAGLLGQSLQRLQRVELGFDPAEVTTGTLGLQDGRFEKPWEQFFVPLLERLAAAPGVEGVALSSSPPFAGGNTGMPIEGVGETQMGGAPLQTDWRMVSPEYFETMRIPLIRGRVFSSVVGADDRTIVVSATMARRMWGGADPVGRQILAGPNGAFTVVGVVGDVRNLDLALSPAPTMYLPTTRYLWPSMTLIVRAGERAQAAALLRRTVRELDPQLAIYELRRMTDQIDRSAAQPRLNAAVTGSFALVAALLAAIGIYGVLAYLVSEQKHEIGIRMALGAGRAAVLRLFLGRGVWLAAAGLGTGVIGAALMTRWISSLLFEVRVRDPWTIAAAAVAVGVVTLVASYLPARRATRVDPLTALRSE